MSEQLTINPQEFGLDENQAIAISSEFSPVISERDALSQIYDQVITKEITKELTVEARDLRLKLVKVRTNTDKIHKAQKAFFLAGGRFVDAWKNKNVVAISQMEEKLTEIENYYINIEKERVAKLKSERIGKLSTVCDTPEMYPVETMSDEAFDQLFTGLELAKQQRIEAERKAEEERIAREEEERKEQERIKAENARLKAEAEEAERIREQERKKAEEERKAIEETARKEREAIELKAKQEREAAEAKLQAEREAARIEAEKAASEKASLEKELREKEAAELSAKQEAERIEQERIKAEKEAAKLPVKQKLTKWIESQEISIPDGLESNEKAVNIKQKFEAFKKWAKAEIDSM